MYWAIRRCGGSSVYDAADGVKCVCGRCACRTHTHTHLPSVDGGCLLGFCHRGRNLLEQYNKQQYCRKSAGALKTKSVEERLCARNEMKRNSIRPRSALAGVGCTLLDCLCWSNQSSCKLFTVRCTYRGSVGRCCDNLVECATYRCT